MTLFKKGVETLRAICPQALYLSLVGMATPLLLFSWIFAVRGLEKANEISGLAFTAPPRGLSDLMAPLITYVGSYVIAGFLLILLVGASYFGILKLVLNQLEGKSLDSATRYFWGGFKSFFPKIAVFALLGGLILGLGEIFLFPAMILAIFFAFAPVIAVAEKRSLLGAFTHSVALRFAKGHHLIRRAAFFQLMGFGAIFYAALLAIFYLEKALRVLDESIGLQRDLWLAPVAGKLPAAFSVVDFVAILAMVATLLAFAIISAIFYTFVKRAGIARADGVRV